MIFPVLLAQESTSNIVDLGYAFKLKGNSSLATTFTTGIRGFISLILPNIFVVAGIILLFLIVFGAIGMITSAGNPEAQQKSKGVVTNAAIGFAIIFMSYWLIQIIQILTGVPILTGD